MNRKNLVGFIVVILMVTSGPLYLPLVLASTQEATNETHQDGIPLTNPFIEDQYQYNTTDKTLPDFSPFEVVYNYTYTDPELDTKNTTQPQEQTYLIYHDRTPEKEPSITFTSNVKEGESPLPVKFNTIIETPEALGEILLIKYDFDGDGYNDYATYQNQPVTHVYMVEAETTMHPTVTVVFKNWCIASKSIDLIIHPINNEIWESITRFGYTRFAINKNGTLAIYDEKDWIQVTPKREGEPLKNPTINSFDDFNKRLTFDTDTTTLHVDITYSLAGRAQLTFTETTKEDALITETSALDLPTVKSGRLDFKPNSFDNVNETTRIMTMDAGNHNPWTDQGLVPYGEYFKNENEYVSTQTGFLTVTQIDLYIPGRGLDLFITRVHTPPSYFYGNQPASTATYSYQDYPWAPIGKGWQLSFPWIETKTGSPAYIRFPDGQRYKYDGAGASGTEYHSGDHFKLYGYTNGTYSLFTVDGTRYNYDSTYKPTTIKDTCGNTISFTYSANKITTITDTIGRTVSLSYNANGQVSSISSGNRTVNYSYGSGAVSGYVLTEVTDPDGRKTKYTYNLDYLVTKVEYPTGGHTAYEYNVYDSSGYYQYRVQKQIAYDGKGDHVQRYFIYDGGFDYVDKTTIKESLQTMNTMKTTKMTYSQYTVTEEAYNGKESDPRLYKDVKTVSEDRRRIDIDHYPGNNAYAVEMIQKYDNWGNLIYRRDYEGHNSYCSYSNTDSSGVFKDTNGQVYIFSDSFYSNNIKPNIHCLLLGAAELQNGAGSSCIEQYNQYNFDGSLTQTKKLLNASWVTASYTYDSYGNMIRGVNPESQTTYYEYGPAYSSAYLTATKQKLTDTKNVTTSYTYYHGTGDLKRAMDPYGNSTKYEYDVLGRVTKQTNPETNSVITYKTAEYYDEVTFSGSPNMDVVMTGAYSDWFFTQTFNAEGRTWVFVYYSDILRFYSSTDQETWSTATQVPGSNYYAYWNLYFDGEYVHLVFSKGQDSTDVYYMRGNPNGDGTITWSGFNKAYDTGSLRAYRPSITVTDNYVWICFDYRAAESNKDPYVTCSSNMNGGWTTRTGFPTKMDDCIRNVYGKLTPLSNDKVYFAYSDRAAIEGYLWNGASWSSKEAIDSVGSYCTFDLASWGYDVWLFVSYGLTSNSWSKVRMRTYTSGSWNSGTNVAWTYANQWASMQLSKGPAYGTLYAFWQSQVTPYGIYYKYLDGATWGPETQLEADSTADSPYGTVSSSDETYEGKTSLVYATGSATETYQLKHNFMPTSKATSESSVRVTDENGVRIKQYYDGLGRQSKYERFNGSTSYSTKTYKYNLFGLLSKYTDEVGYTYRYEYNAAGMLTKQTNPDSSYSQNVVNYAGNYVDVIDEEGRQRRLKYDWCDRLVEVDEYYQAGSFYVTGYIYDEVGNLVKITDSLSRETSYTYDQLNRLTQIQHSDSLTEEMAYDKVSNLIRKTDREGSDTYYTYDGLDRLVNASSIGVDVLYSYDEMSRRIGSSYNGTSMAWSYDARNRLLEERYNIAGSIYTVGYSYDGVGNIIGIVYPDSSSVSMTYDALNRLRNVVGIASVRHTQSDKVSLVTYGNGVTATYTYDSRDRPVCIETKRGSTVLLRLAYTYDKTGSVKTISDGASTETYGYDLLDRLTSSSGPWGGLSYTYDSVGNRLSLNRGGSVTSYTYDNMNRISSGTGMAFTWDGNGNLATWDDGSNDWAYRYDPEDRLINVKKNGVASAQYTYDAGGRRVRSWDTAGTTDYVYSGLIVIDEIKAEAHEKYIYAGSMHLASNSSGTIEYYHVDHLGSTRLKTNSTGGVIYESNYEPYGPEYGESGSEEFRYTGKQEDPTGLYYFGARYYDPVTGRFTTRDSVFGDLTDPQSLNRYVYCRNNPHKYTDPDGRWMHIVVGAAIGAAINIGMYTVAQYAMGKEFGTEEFNRGLVAAGVSGAISGAVSAAIGPIAGSVAVKLGYSSTSLVAKTISFTAQGGAEVFSYATEATIKGNEINAMDAATRFIVGGSMSVASNKIIEGTHGMYTLKQSKYFAPKKISTYYNALINPDSSRNAASIIRTIAFEAFGTALVTSGLETLQKTSTHIPTSYDLYESRRY
ncbi:MAG: RHS repeat-associated core domain-containing protein [Candidatus Bathyarchaeota archaeon]